MEFQEVNVNLEMVVFDEPRKAALHTWVTAVTVGNWVIESQWRTQGWGLGTRAPLRLMVLIFKQFRQNLCQIIG